jgi:hypothetical protein
MYGLGHGASRCEGRAKRMYKLVLAASLVACLQAASARAQTAAAQPPPFTPLRYNEDYSYLRDPARRSGAWWEPLKYLPLDSDGWAWVSPGQHRRKNPKSKRPGPAGQTSPPAPFGRRP